MRIPIWRKLVFCALVAAPAFMVAEWALRGPLDPNTDKLFAELVDLSEYHPTRTWHLAAGRRTARGERVNSLGFEGPEFDRRKPEAVFRIFAIGDSCNYADPGSSYVYQLGRLLNELADPGVSFEVINAGCIGYSARQAKQWFLEEIQFLEPDLITVYIGWNNIFDARHYLTREPGAGEVVEIPAGNAANFIRAQSKLARVLEALDRGVRTAADAPPDPDVIEHTLRGLATWQALGVRQPLAELLQAAGDRGLGRVVMTLPTLMRPDLPEELMHRVSLSFLPDFESERLAHATVNRAIREVSAQQRVRLVDLDAAFRERDDLADLFTYDHIHIWPAPGHVAVACKILEALLEMDLPAERRVLPECQQAWDLTPAPAETG